MSVDASNRGLNFRNISEQNHSACATCSSAVRLDRSTVQCGASGRQEHLVTGRCKLRKWTGKRGELPGVWVLSYQRTGSYYLCAMLNQLGFSPPLDELYHPSKQADLTMPPRNNKTHPSQLAYRGMTLSDVIEQLPNTKFIVIRRRDLVACAVSLYLAGRTNTWWVTSDQEADRLARRQRIPLDDRGLMRSYERVRHDDVHWCQELESLGIDYHEVFYEDLTEKPTEAIAKILSFIGVESDPELCTSGVPNRKQSVFRKETEEYSLRLRFLIQNESSAPRPAPRPSCPRIDPRRLIIGALSCTNAKYQSRRMKCQQTWLPELEAAGAEVLFLVGVGDTIDKPRLVERKEHGRIGLELQIPCPDTYEALPQKTAAFCRWACANREFDYLFKCDDDTYLVPRRFLNVDLQGVDYLGAPLFINIPYASGGAGYFLSHHAAHIVAEEMQEATGPEDLIVSQHLARRGVALQPDRRFLAVGSDGHRPMPCNDLITSHANESPWSRHQETWHQAWEAWEIPKPSRGSKIALLFLLRSDLNHPLMWEGFVEQGGVDVNVYAHSKQLSLLPIETSLIRDNQIQERVDTRWGDVSLVRAMLALLREALACSDNQFFVFASESCVPIRPFDSVYDALLRDGRSWIRSMPCPERVAGVHPAIIPPESFMKTSQWLALNRDDAQAIVDTCRPDGLEQVFAPDEHYAATSLAMAGRNLQTDVIPRDLTFTEWAGGTSSPTSFVRVDSLHIQRLIASGCLFARKYPPQSNIAEFRKYLLDGEAMTYATA